jgi:ATP-dependent helicase YprA (DUF1998 family)
MGGSGIATVTVEFVSANPDQSQNFTYALSLVRSLEVVPEPSSLALLVSGLVAAVAFFRWSAAADRIRRQLRRQSADPAASPLLATALRHCSSAPRKWRLRPHAQVPEFGFHFLAEE